MRRGYQVAALTSHFNGVMALPIADRLIRLICADVSPPLPLSPPLLMMLEHDQPTVPPPPYPPPISLLRRWGFLPVLDPYPVPPSLDNQVR